MILDLEQFQSPLPYPVLRTVKPDVELASKLMDGYSGKTSELTTILQYAYHCLQCKSKYHDIARVIRGIFYVETMHMNYLGECIEKLGGSPKYKLTQYDQSTFWQASLVDYEASPSEMLWADIQGEQQATKFYEQSAAIAKQPEVVHLLKRLAEDEKLHVRIFMDLYRRHFQR